MLCVYSGSLGVCCPAVPSKTAAMASPLWASSFPSLPRSGLVAGEVVKACWLRSSTSVSPAGCGGKGGSCWVWALRFGGGHGGGLLWRFLLWPAEVARGAGAGKLRGAAGGGLGRRRVGGKKGGAGRLALWPCAFIGSGFCRGAADDSAVFYNGWRRSLLGGWWHGGSGDG